MLRHTDLSHLDISHQPNQRTCRKCEDHRPPQNEKRPVDDGGVKSLQKTGWSIGRKLKAERADFPLKPGSGKKPGDGQR